MRSQIRARTALVMSGIFVVAQLAGCFSERPDTTAPITGDDCPVPANALGAGKAVITIYKFAFYPDTLRITAGTTVTWVNCDVSAGQDAHTSTSDTDVWESPPFAEGQVFARSFAQSGTFPYHCEPHPSMRAVVIVQ